MPNYLIGKENLPNVYISSIVIDEDNVAVKLCMYDYNEPERSTWHSNPHMSDLKVLVVTTADTNIINSINITGSSLLDFEQSDFTSYDAIKGSQFGITDQGTNSISKYEYKLTLNRDSLNNNTLNIYACTYVPINLFPNPQLNKYCGAVTGEKIFENGEVPTQSGYFYYPDTNEEYGGPIHFHGEEFMEGSSHRNVSHKIVRYVPETNTKITVESQDE